MIDQQSSSETTSLAQLGHHPERHNASEQSVPERLANAFGNSRLPLASRLANFPRHTRRQDIARFLAKYELFKLVLPANGSIVECGVFCGGGLASWTHFSACLEPFNHTRRVIGFDTFDGFPTIAQEDETFGGSRHLSVGAFRTHSTIQDEIMEMMAVHDANRPVGHIPKVELVAGDASKTIEEYVKRTPHLLISLLYLDFDLYEPTVAALKHLLPRVVKGGIVAFDELNCPDFPGETTAMLEAEMLSKYQLQRSVLDPYMSYFRV